MKRKTSLTQFALLMGICLLFFGCAHGNPPEETTFTPTTIPTETFRPTLLERAEPWEGAEELLLLPVEELELSSGIRIEAFGDLILLWEHIYRDDWVSGIRLRLMEPEYGQILADRTIPQTEWFEPQIRDGMIGLCDSVGGTVTVLDDRLETVQEWTLEPDWGRWILGYGNRLYQLDDTGIRQRDLETGEERILLESENGCYCNAQNTDYASLSYTEPDTGAHKTACLDLTSGILEQQPYRGNFDTAVKHNDLWLNRRWVDGRSYRLGNGAEAWDLYIPNGILYMTDGGHLMTESAEGAAIYDLGGNYLAGCIPNNDESYVNFWDGVWCETLDGYLFLAYSLEDNGAELLFWDMEGGVRRENLELIPVDLTLTPEEEIADLQHRADTLGEPYGLTVHIGTECDREYDDFTAAHQTDPEMIRLQLDVLERALDAYPEGFLGQLCYDSYETIEIHLVKELTARPHYGNGGSYAAFVQPRDGFYLMVMDTNVTAEGTYYHEFSHIIDDYLQWESWNRDGALFSEETWQNLSPEDFSYSWDYALEQPLDNGWEEWFIDSYSTINPTEDRARILEYGMMDGCSWFFEEKSGARAKLEWYARCIRDAFDTAGWPEQTLWEQYLE